MSLAMIALVALLSTYIVGKAAATEPPMPGGELHILDQQGQPSGACPLKHTEVEASIQGFSAAYTCGRCFTTRSARRSKQCMSSPCLRTLQWIP